LTKTADRAIGALIGLAVGDALGTTLEFTGRDTRPPLTDMVGGGPFELEPGEWTDDTSLALCLADSLIQRQTLDPHDLMTRFVSWFREGEYTSNGRCFDIGGATRTALERFERSGDPIAGATSSQSAGNGSIMRLAPVAIYWRNDDVKAVDAAKRQSQTTHGAAEAVEACALLCNVLLAAINGRGRKRCFQQDPATYATPKIKALAAGSWRSKSRDDIRSSGYVIDTLEAALWAVAQARDFGEAVLLAVNLGEDADTVGAVAGQIAGALFGASSIPVAWRTRLAHADRIEGIAKRLAAPRGG
jgi:ADP-ribosylglycohydrolase